ncbi:hydroxymethylglutaryl-CoA lyase [Rubrobacter indicoceani]|uniref:hydroxymethylglutaryl-CoA lyase n=1 Tax=Rubrobacter indicoceani TaxID=2051957 RepID=UPI000E5C289A|nr:hydroxymethylglutaryl-CoA lyase [Rubrobacter indicoceani]
MSREDAPHRKVEIVEVGPRDGLQNETVTLSPEDRAELCDLLVDAGLRRIEAASFVNPKRVPQMAGAEKVLSGVSRKPGVSFAGLVLNERGYERAVAAGVDEVRYAYPLTDEFARRNQNSTVEAGTELAGRLAELAARDGVGYSVTFAVTFGCPFEGEVKPERVLQVAREVAASEPDEIILADTIGVAVPTQVRELVGGLRSIVNNNTDKSTKVGCHFHDTRHTGIANAIAAAESGATVLDASIGGTGGCPFAPRATGNIATEDLVYALHGMGYTTGADLDKLIECAGWMSGKLGKELAGRVYKAGTFTPVAG